MAQMKYKVENKLPFQNTGTNVETTNNNRQLIHTQGIGMHWL